MKPIRNSAKAVIVQNGQLLVIRLEDQYGTAYVFPGGGQEKGEELKDAVARECLEEIGQAVNVGELLHIREYIGKNHEFAEWDADIHQVEFYFACSLIDPEATVFEGSNPDDHQVAVEWIALEELSQIRLYPKTIGELLLKSDSSSIYLGDLN
ncbi:NUDIX domain-containing protein [Paenibacillus polymyxa]|uniref:NUDIX domain-containing protein n=1 Tax=Paenibacillus TaxID=44249 RepID=UPI000890640B|nr:MULTISPECIES: NUDIX domain-containing protein [Paenibacillus]UOK64114.1 NUDIX domain-containing protein [Paenibacillus sp. OVF10]MCL6662805.1 NUDIX domain-containing protein [Paenibacillus amylolyticus]TDL63187.1 NUDIX domain-containing protein [Paenibacillus amylolyticus]WJM08829.1 NUDIX domain-containing protein [Paenibacillus sp. PK1-4R]SDD72853.1 ADP-ribose pyrophosphatase YjhB, NUDIX family [Paenibacillus sp. CF095]